MILHPPISMSPPMSIPLIPLIPPMEVPVLIAPVDVGVMSMPVMVLVMSMLPVLMSILLYLWCGCCVVVTMVAVVAGRWLGGGHCRALKLARNVGGKRRKKNRQQQ